MGATLPMSQISSTRRTGEPAGTLAPIAQAASEAEEQLDSCTVHVRDGPEVDDQPMGRARELLPQGPAELDRVGSVHLAGDPCDHDAVVTLVEIDVSQPVPHAGGP